MCLARSLARVFEGLGGVDGVILGVCIYLRTR